MNIPENLSYTATHEWIHIFDDGLAEIGLSDFAQEELGDIVFVDLPRAGDHIVAGEKFADVESVKAVSDVFSPVSGTVVSVNAALLDSPESINKSPYDSWMVRVTNITAQESFLSAEEYRKQTGAR